MGNSTKRPQITIHTSELQKQEMITDLRTKHQTDKNIFNRIVDNITTERTQQSKYKL